MKKTRDHVLRDKILIKTMRHLRPLLIKKRPARVNKNHAVDVILSLLEEKPAER